MLQNGDQSLAKNNGHRLNRYFQYAISIISSYKGNEPFHLFLKRYFSANKKHGARDRKIIASLCYNYFRIGEGIYVETDLQKKFLLSTFLCEKDIPLSIEGFKPDWKDSFHLSVFEKLKIIEDEVNAKKIFPFGDELSHEIDLYDFCISFLVQPRLFARVRPGFRNTVIDKLNKENFFYEEIGDDCLSFSDYQKVTEVLKKDKEVVIQDLNSQKTLDLLKPFSRNLSNQTNVWDCCAGSGGKSILAFDIFENIKLTVSDKRKSILQNCKLRFSNAGIRDYTLLLADLAIASSQKIKHNHFDIIIADVPCTGSGTWARTPEHLTFFDKKDIERYTSLQKKIAGNVMPHLKETGYFLYITCSVFEKENEENVAFIQQNFHLNLLKMEYLKGYKLKADTLFVALLKK